MGAEQVGFVSTSGNVARLDMMGGEFCGNAVQSLVAMLAWEESALLPKQSGNCWKGYISSSGVESLLCVSAEWRGNALYCRSEMPNATLDPVQLFGKPAHLARMGGITHVLLDCSFPFPDDYSSWCAKARIALKLNNEPAVGCIWYSEQNSKLSIRPVVWVRDQSHTCYETACGSGTLAVGLLYATNTQQSSHWPILQPSGCTICAEVELRNGKAQSCWLSGEVRVVARGEVVVE